jgi:hypothetical protein
MRILPDESLPKRLKFDFKGHDIKTVSNQPSQHNDSYYYSCFFFKSISGIKTIGFKDVKNHGNAFPDTNLQDILRY